MGQLYLRNKLSLKFFLFNEYPKERIGKADNQDRRSSLFPARRICSPLILWFYSAFQPIMLFQVAFLSRVSALILSSLSGICLAYKDLGFDWISASFQLLSDLYWRSILSICSSCWIVDAKTSMPQRGKASMSRSMSFTPRLRIAGIKLLLVTSLVFLQHFFKYCTIWMTILLRKLPTQFLALLLLQQQDLQRLSPRNWLFPKEFMLCSNLISFNFDQRC